MPKTTVNFTDNKRNTTKEKFRKNSCEIHQENDQEKMKRIIDQELTLQEIRDEW
ncbi:MAG: hypothetical protein MI810_01110 [Flavobacteriales bacterium]|nr:hypothetical protein [Flavobacteriales bacterium]